MWSNPSPAMKATSLPVKKEARYAPRRLLWLNHSEILVPQ